MVKGPICKYNSKPSLYLIVSQSTAPPVSVVVSVCVVILSQMSQICARGNSLKQTISRYPATKQFHTVLLKTLTFKEGAEVSPAGDTALRRVLPHGSLQEEHWNSTREQKQDIWNQKCTCE